MCFFCDGNRPRRAVEGGGGGQRRHVFFFRFFGGSIEPLPRRSLNMISYIQRSHVIFINNMEIFMWKYSYGNIIVFFVSEFFSITTTVQDSTPGEGAGLLSHDVYHRFRKAPASRRHGLVPATIDNPFRHPLTTQSARCGVGAT